MRTTLLILILILGGCVSATQDGGGAYVAVPKVTAEGSFDGWIQATYGTMPLTAKFIMRGNGTVIVHPIPPYLTFSGDAQFIVEPLPEYAQQAEADLATGRVTLYRSGRPGRLNPPGTIRGAAAPLACLPKRAVKRMPT